MTQLCPGGGLHILLACLVLLSAAGNQVRYFISLLRFAEPVKFPSLALLLCNPHPFQEQDLGATWPHRDE